MYKNRSQGFTLIELLVVIAIIGILSAVVLASLNTARTKGQDAAIKSNLESARVQAELFYGNGSTYDAVCTTGTNNIAAIVLGAAQVLGTTNTVGADAVAASYNASGGVGSAVCHDSADAYAIWVSLKTPVTPNSGWCVDSTGAAKEVLGSAVGASDYAC